MTNHEQHQKECRLYGTDLEDQFKFTCTCTARKTQMAESYTPPPEKEKYHCSGCTEGGWDLPEGRTHYMGTVEHPEVSPPEKEVCGALVQATVMGDITCQNEKPCKTHAPEKLGEELIDGIVRDITKVGFVAKSDVKKRILEAIESAVEAERKRIVEGLPKEKSTRMELILTTVREYQGYNQCLADVKKLIEKE